ncbi:PfkB family carbohydrate kinase [Streptomyces tsukubensis]|uniref:PfkB family carbohydrate kinase n=1 Tax=Streptomyces tsukubensis TaxID=83656 RepID=UPI00344B64C5
MGALNVDYIASASGLSRRTAEQVHESVARFEWNTEGPVDQSTVAKAIERLGSAALDASLGGSAWLTVYTLAQLRLDIRLGYVGVAGRIETPGLSFLGQMDELGIDRQWVARRPDLTAGVCLSYLDDVERVMLTHPGANFAMADHLTAHADEIAGYLSGARLVHVTSFLDDRTPEVLAGVLGEAKRRGPGMRISFDPGFDWAQNPGPGVEAVLGLSDLVFVNHRELKALGGYAVGESDDVLASRVLERVPGATLFVTKRYDAVEVYRTAGGGLLARRFRLRRRIREGTVEDATGAGDVFAASVLAALASGRLQVELGARLGLDLSRQRTGRRRGGGLPRIGDGLLTTPEDPAGPDSHPRAVLVASEGSRGGGDRLDRFLTHDLALRVDRIDLSAVGADGHRPLPGPERTGAGPTGPLPPTGPRTGRVPGRPAGWSAMEERLARCGFAVCVLTATQVMAGGSRRVGERLVHQVGLFQGCYGFGRVALLTEEGCEAPSNIAGLIRLDFPPGRVESVFWELERMLAREGFLQGRQLHDR